MQFQDKVVLITGAAGGFGKLLAQRLSERGAKLVLGDLNEQGVKAVAQSLPGDALGLACDVAKEDQVQALADACISHFGQLDIAVNNAGMSTQMKSLLQITEQEMDLNFAVNAKGVLFGMKSQIPLMLQQGGSILNVSSMAGLGAAPKLAPYCAAKHAVVGLTKTAAVEFAKKNVRVNAICPFFSYTPLIDSLLESDMEGMMVNGSPMKRLADPEEIVTVMLSMIAPDNTYMTGQCIAVDGGVSAL